MPDIEISGYTTHYEDHDFSTPWIKSEVVLIQHGFGRNANFWFQWVPKIANDFRLIRRDLRGHGGTTDPENLPWSFDRLVDDMRDFCDALNLEAIHLIGESTGGMLSVGFACQSASKRDPLSARKRDPLSGWRKLDVRHSLALRAA